MEKIEDKIHKELKSKNINNKNYLWVITFLICVVGISYYSYTNQMGVIAKQSIDKEFTVKNQKNLEQLFKEHLSNPQRQFEEEHKEQGLYDSAAIIVQNDIPVHDEMSEEDPTFDLNKGPEVEVNDEEIAASDIPMTSPDVQRDFIASKEPQSLAKVPEAEVEQAKVAVVEPQVVAQTKVTTQPITIKQPEPKQESIVVQKEPEIKPVETPKVIKQTSNEVALVEEPKHAFDLIKCYNLQSNEAQLTAVCKDKIREFLQLHKQASRFEVIGVIDLIDEKEVISQNKYKNVYHLGEDRVKEAKQLIQQHLGQNVSILEHNYTLKTELEDRGVVIRAYN